MRYRALVVSVIVAIAGQCAQAQEGEAEKLFRAMHRKIASAKSLQVVVKMKGKTPDFDEKTAIQLALWVQGTDQVRCELRISNKDKEDVTALMVCDGTAMALRANSKTKLLPLPAHLGTSVKDSLVTPGADLVMGVLMSDPDAQKTSLVNSAFKLGAKEKVAEREAQVVQYVANAKDGKPEEAVNIALWIDTQTSLPVKRVCDSQGGTRTEETYHNWQLNGKLESKLFELPK